MPTLSEIRTSVSAKTGLGSTGTEGGYIDVWINEGVREVLLRTHVRVNCADLNLTADEWKYDLPSGVLAIRHVVDTDGNEAEQIPFPDLIDLRRTSSSAGNVRLRYAVLGANLFAVWPTPTAADALDLYYVPAPAEMSDDAHDPSTATYGGIPVQYHKAIELWALAQASDYGHEQRTQSGVNYLAQFDEYIRRFVRPSVNRIGGRKGRVLIGRRRWVAQDNGVYPA